MHTLVVAMFGKPFNRNELIDTVGRSVLKYEEKWGAKRSEKGGKNGGYEVAYKCAGLEDAVSAHQLGIGRGGLFLKVDDKLPAVSDTIYFNVEFEGESLKQLEGEGVVRWVRRQNDRELMKGIGLEISSIIGSDRPKVVELFESQDSVAYIPKGLMHKGPP